MLRPKKRRGENVVMKSWAIAAHSAVVQAFVARYLFCLSSLHTANLSTLPRACKYVFKPSDPSPTTRSLVYATSMGFSLLGWKESFDVGSACVERVVAIMLRRRFGASKCRDRG
jgi:hypothetical protein